jgi:hypothetical protein
MHRCKSRAVVARRAVLTMACMPLAAGAATVRIVSYNIQDDVSSPTPAAALPNVETAIEGIGQQQYVGDGILKLPDVIAIQETTNNATSIAPVVTALNSYYNHPNLFSASSYQATTYQNDSTVGGGPNALIYNQTTLNLVASIGVGTPAGSTNGEFRQVVRYEFQPLIDAGTNNGIFYVYDSHMKSGSAGTSDDGTTDGAMRNLEAQLIRNDEATNLPSTASVVYAGDFNGDGSTEAAYQTMTAANSPGNVNQGQGIDPLNASDNLNLTWGSVTPTILTESDIKLEYRDDIQFLTPNVYNGSSSTLDYVSGSFHAFGNNGTSYNSSSKSAYESSVNQPVNTALNDINSVTRSNALPAGSLTSATVLTAMNGSIGSDHLPVVADYTVSGFNNGIWTGGSGNWNNFTFWTNEVVPNSSTLEVKIDNGNSVVSAVTLNQNATVEDLTLDSNNSLTISPGYTMVLAGPNPSAFNGNLNNTGGLTASTANNTGTFTTTGTYAGTGSFNNSGTATFGGTQNWSAGTVFLNTAGTAIFNTDAGSQTSLHLSINVSGGSVTLNSTQHLAGLNIAAGSLVTLTNTGSKSLLVTSPPTIAGTLDLTNNYLDIPGGNLSSTISLVKKGFNGGTWSGSGITSSTAAANTSHLTALGVIQNNQSGSALFAGNDTFDGITPGASDILVRFTYYGDANLDGKVDGSDYSLIDNGYLNNLTGWFNGDFNFDGAVNGSDYTLIDNAFNSQGAKLTSQISNPSATIAVQLAGTSSVPEPVSIGMLAIIGSALLGRRHRGRTS